MTAQSTTNDVIYCFLNDYCSDVLNIDRVGSIAAREFPVPYVQNVLAGVSRVLLRFEIVLFNLKKITSVFKTSGASLLSHSVNPPPFLTSKLLNQLH